MNREEIIKAFLICHSHSDSDPCISCPFAFGGEGCNNVEKAMVVIVKELLEENEKLKGLYEYNPKLAIEAEHKLTQYENRYEDELSRITMLLSNAQESLEEKNKLFENVKVITVQKMLDKLKKRLPIISPSVFDQIAKTVLEESDDTN